MVHSCVLQDIGPLGHCLAITPLLLMIVPSRASGTADLVQSLDDLFSMFVCVGGEGDGVGIDAPTYPFAKTF